jgi:hypothetical protein
MSFDIRTEPIDRWPLPETPAAQRKSIQFKAGYDNTLRLLRTELEHLRAQGAVVIQVVTRNGAADVRRDGLLMARAKIEHRGVRLAFESKHGPLTYSSDVYEGRYYSDMPDWQANLRAIALSLEALRAVDRYGVSKSGEQYRGWRAIEAGTGGISSVSAAVEVIRNAAHGVESMDEDLSTTLRRARRKTHPDRNGGDHSRWNELEAAVSVARANGLLS